MKGKGKKMLAAAAAAAAAGVYLKRARDQQKSQDASRIRAIEEAVMNNRDYGKRQAYLIGGGLTSMAAAAYLIRDCKFPGNQITIYESQGKLGGGSFAGREASGGFGCQGFHLLNEETYENFWELFGTIPSLDKPERSVAEEILSFSHTHSVRAGARLVNREGKAAEVSSMGLEARDRLALLKLLFADEKRLDNRTIQDWFRETPHFFTTNFWYLWQTTFAFQKWSSLFEFRRGLMRMAPQLDRLGTMEGMVSTPFNRYDCVIRPLEQYLRQAGVNFEENCQVTDLDFDEGPGLTIKAFYLKRDRGVREDQGARYIHEIRKLEKGDICIMTNGSVTDGAVMGGFYEAVPQRGEEAGLAKLWVKAAARNTELGKPESFFAKPHETGWMSFTVTCRGERLWNAIRQREGNGAGCGGFMTLKESPWLLTTITPAQPYFRDQREDERVFFGYGLYLQTEGDLIRKPMRDCTGQEILREYLHQLGISEREAVELMTEAADVVTCYMPYGGASRQPRRFRDRPQVAPAGSRNFAFAGQFVELSGDMAFTEEYAVRAARTAVYTLMGVNRPVCPAVRGLRRPGALWRALKAVMS